MITKLKPGYIVKVLYMLLLWCQFVVVVHAQPTDNVVAYYPFLGDVNDYTVNGKNCANNGATLTSDRLGNANTAYSFNGSGNYLLLPATLLPTNSAFSISCWVKPTGTHSTTDPVAGIVDLRGQYNTFLGYNQSNHTTNPNSVRFNIYSNPANGTITSANNTVQPGTWYHVVANYGGNSMELYLNGSLVGSQTINQPAIVTGYNNMIGKDYRYDLNRGWFNGAIDEVVVYSKKLTLAEVQALYNRGFTTNQIPELCKPVSFQYDVSGNCTDRNIIILTSTPLLVKSDSLKALLKSAKAMDGGDSIEQAFTRPEVKFEDDLGTQKISIYPNPTKGQLAVEVKGLDATSLPQLYLFDLGGKLLVRKTITDTNIPLDLSSYISGTYLLKIVCSNKSSEWKIIKE